MTVAAIFEAKLTREQAGRPPALHAAPHGTVVVVEPGTPLRWQNDSDQDALIFAYGAPAESNAEILEG